jgi:hypothetical protein
MLERIGRWTIDQKGFAKAMAAKPLIPADGPQRDRFFLLALVCRRSLAGTQPGSSKLERDLFPFLPRAR